MNYSFKCNIQYNSKCRETAFLKETPWLCCCCNTVALFLSFSIEPISLPPQLPPRNFTSNEGKDCHGDPCRGMERGAETTQASFSDTYLQRLQQIDLTKYNDIHLSYCKITACTFSYHLIPERHWHYTNSVSL